jgi:PUA domain protein
MKKKTLSKKEIRELNEKISNFGFQFGKKDLVEILDDGDHRYINYGNEVVFFYLNEELLPSLRLILSGKTRLKKIIVDMGAVKFVVNGADIMRPGIVEIDECIEEGDIIQIVDVNNRKPLAIGEALFNAEKMNAMKEGKVIKNMHYIGDEIWNFSH